MANFWENVVLGNIDLTKAASEDDDIYDSVRPDLTPKLRALTGAGIGALVGGAGGAAYGAWSTRTPELLAARNNAAQSDRIKYLVAKGRLTDPGKGLPLKIDGVDERMYHELGNATRKDWAWRQGLKGLGTGAVGGALGGYIYGKLRGE